MTAHRIILAWCISLAVAQAETRVRITGLARISEAQTIDLMGGRLAHVRASPPSAPLADDAAFILRRILHKEGYADAAVDWKITGRDEITLIVREGLRLSLGKVTVSGVPREDARRFARLYASPAMRGRNFALGPPPFREQDIETGLSNLRQELNARGHWAAEAELAKRTTQPTTGAVDVDIALRPGPLHRIGPPEVASVDGRGVKLVGNAVRPFEGRTATTRNLNAMRLAAEEIAISRGYPDAQIRMARRLEADRFIPLFNVDLGTRVRLHQLHITGLERTAPERVASRLRGLEDGWYDAALMNRRLREMLATGAFDSARVETTPAGHRRVDATLRFTEGRAREVGLAAGFGSYQGLITRATYADRNFLGKLWSFTSGIELSSRGVLGDARLTDPWLGGHDLSATARAYALIYGREGYDVYQAGFEGGLGWRFGDHYFLDLLAGWSLVNLSADGLPASELGENNYLNPRIRLTQRLDFRDSPVLPTRGWHLQSPFEFGAAVGDVSTSYLLGGLSGGWFHPISRRYQIGIGGECHILVPSGDGADLPIDLRLFNGGSRSVRSFPARELGPTVNGYATGGEAAWHMNAELIRRLGGSLNVVGFIDAGALARDYDDLISADVELATGLGVRFDLPVGPVRLEYGHNLTRDAGEPSGTFHFAIGSAF